MHTKTQNTAFSYKVTFLKARVWLQVMLSYLFIAAMLATLICAYLKEANITIITIFLLVGGLIGIYKAEVIRKSIGLEQYGGQLSKQRDLQ